jgi:hypothetical protein
MSVGIGSEYTQFTVVLDITSGDFWVPGSNCTIDGCAGRQTLGTQDSVTLEVSQDTWHGVYSPLSGGDASGVLANDTVSFVGFNLLSTQLGLASQVNLSLTNGVRSPWHCGLMSVVV